MHDSGTVAPFSHKSPSTLNTALTMSPQCPSFSIKYGCSPATSDSISHPPPFRLRHQTSHRFLKCLGLPIYRYLIDVFLPERHLLAILHSNPVGQSVCILSDAPERTVFDFGDLEIDGFRALVFRILYDDADNTGGKEVTDCLGREYNAAPVGNSVLCDWGESARHNSGIAPCYFLIEMKERVDLETVCFGRKRCAMGYSIQVTDMDDFQDVSRKDTE